MGKKETVEVLVEGGKATAAPPIGPTLGALKVNIGEVVSEINKKTGSYKGMKVPVKIVVDAETKEFEITVGTPPTSQLIKKELNLQKGSPMPNLQKVENISIEQLIKVAKMKKDAFIGSSLKSVVKSIAGSCSSLGILIEGKNSEEFNKEIDSGKYNKEIKEELTETPEEKKKVLNEQLELEKKEFEKQKEKLAVKQPQKEEEKEEEKEEKK